MSRNQYGDAFGVCDIEWREGEPDRAFLLVLVEVWRAGLDGVDPQYSNPFRSQVNVTARVEVRVLRGGDWKVLRWDGALEDPAGGEVRRWARLGLRSWTKVITLDGWAP